MLAVPQRERLSRSHGVLDPNRVLRDAEVVMTSGREAGLGSVVSRGAIP